jgi:cyclophilin family peptidyl-prolyl cis-trans isomerase
MWWRHGRRRSGRQSDGRAAPSGPGDHGPYSADDQALHRPVIYPRRAVAMANTGPYGNCSQFFAVYTDTELPPKHTGFGTIDQTALATLSANPAIDDDDQLDSSRLTYSR